MKVILKKPSAWVPIALSLIVLAMFVIGIALFGPPARLADEGVGAHLFQIWLLLEVLMVAFFALKWVPQNPRSALFVVAIQILAVIAACAPVRFFNL